MPQTQGRARMAVNIEEDTARAFKQAAAANGLSVNQALKLAVYQSLGRGPDSATLNSNTKLVAWLRGK